MEAYKAATEKVKVLTARYQEDNGVASPTPAASTGLAALEGITAGVWRRLAGNGTQAPPQPEAVAVPDRPLARILDVLAWQAAYRTY